MKIDPPFEPLLHSLHSYPYVHPQKFILRNLANVRDLHKSVKVHTHEIFHSYGIYALCQPVVLQSLPDIAACESSLHNVLHSSSYYASVGKVPKAYST